jgi:DNA-binding MarR family transcriptional regulator
VAGRGSSGGGAGSRRSAARDRDLQHTANLLGALALSLHDRTSAAIADVTGQGETGAAALSALGQFLDQPTIGTVDQVLGLSPSGAVRLIDRLEADGYLRRAPGSDGRSRSVRLTRSGKAAAARVAEARAQALEGALSSLSDRERQDLDRLASRLLVGLMRGPGARRWMCRLCDMTACGREEGRCPVANAARERYGSPR